MTESKFDSIDMRAYQQSVLEIHFLAFIALFKNEYQYVVHTFWCTANMSTYLTCTSLFSLLLES
jgi:hypothetical protein